VSSSLDEDEATMPRQSGEALAGEGAELADLQSGVPLDADISVYMTRLCHTHALTEVLLSWCCTSEMAQFKRSLMHCFEPTHPSLELHV